MLKPILLVLLVLIAAITFAVFFFGAPPKRVIIPKPSDHFNGKEFFNPWVKSESEMGLKELGKWKFESENTPWPEEIPADFVIQQKPPGDKKNFIQFIGHATALIDIGGTRLLTDPQLSRRAGPLGLVGPVRKHSLPFSVEEFGRVDFVLISHNHYDHMDLSTLSELQKLYNPTFIVPISNAGYLIEAGIKKEKIVELDWWESFTNENISVTLAPAQHWSKRRLFDRNFALWGSFVVEGKNKKRIFYAGDTGYGDHFKLISKHWSSFNVSLLPVGAYEPRWFMKYHHMNPEEAVLVHLEVKSQKSIGLHHSCFKLTNEGWDDPKIKLTEALTKHKLNEENFKYPRPGEIIEY